jgi:hypothetical protein
LLAANEVVELDEEPLEGEQLAFRAAERAYRRVYDQGV